MKALVIITLQNDFCSFGNASVVAADNLVDIANRIMPFFEKIVAVNFCFPPNHISFAANHLFRQPGKTMLINGRYQLLKSIHCVVGSYGAEFPIGLQKQNIDYIQNVGTHFEYDVYSIFRDLDCHDNELISYMESQNITSMYFMGIGSNFFENSIADAQKKGYEVFVIEDATAANFNYENAKLINSNEIF